MPTVVRAQRYSKVTVANNGDILDLGPAGTGGTVATYMIQFVASLNFIGQFGVMGRLYGTPSVDVAGSQFASIPYRRVNVNGLASDYDMVTDVITGSGIIQVPANGLDVGLLVAISQGTCAIASLDLNGPSAV